MRNGIDSISALSIEDPFLRTKSQGIALRHIEHDQYLMLKVVSQARIKDPQCDAKALPHTYDLAIADGEGSISGKASRDMPNGCLEVNACAPLIRLLEATARSTSRRAQLQMLLNDVV